MRFLRALNKERKFRTNLLIGALLVVVFSFAAVADIHQKAFKSVEVQFTDTSHSGLAIVPASCPSNPHFAGDCLPSGCGAGTLNDTCIYCPDGSLAPNGSAAACTCAQGNAS